jgi:hypothetical protein
MSALVGGGGRRHTAHNTQRVLREEKGKNITVDKKKVARESDYEHTS